MKTDTDKNTVCPLLVLTANKRKRANLVIVRCELVAASLRGLAQIILYLINKHLSLNKHLRL